MRDKRNGLTWSLPIRRSTLATCMMVTTMSGRQTNTKFAKSHTHILYFTKHVKEFTFNADAVRVASARQTTYADRRANPKGKLPDDVWYLDPGSFVLRPQEAPEPLFAADCDTWN